MSNRASEEEYARLVREGTRRMEEETARLSREREKWFEEEHERWKREGEPRPIPNTSYLTGWNFQHAPQNRVVDEATLRSLRTMPFKITPRQLLADWAARNAISSEALTELLEILRKEVSDALII